jgi:hypothetical protein
MNLIRHVGDQAERSVQRPIHHGRANGDSAGAPSCAREIPRRSGGDLTQNGATIKT